MAQALGGQLGCREVLQRTLPTAAPRQLRMIRHLLLVLGDQLNADSAVFDGFDPTQDAVWMAEVGHESTKVWSSKPRTVMFIASMRHFCAALREQGVRVIYRELTENGGRWTGDELIEAVGQPETLADALMLALTHLLPQRVILVEPGEWQVRVDLERAAADAGVPMELREDRHFLCSAAEFAAHARGRKQLRMEYFYREQRVRHDVLMVGGQPAGGAWNFDQENRKSFGTSGPPVHAKPRAFAPDAITREVIALVEQRFAAHPGDLQQFDWPVTAADAELALDDFIEHRLAQFGDWQDAMWTAEPWLFHSRLSAAMNLKLLDPRSVIDAAQQAWRDGVAPLPAVEGFIRQILGWREYVRGVYWLHMPGYLQRNALAAGQDLPGFYWTGETDMACMRDALGQTLRLGYAHHIQRLMVTGLFALLWGARPEQVHAWYLAVYVDAVEWVELPNTLGMSQYADGGVMASKPYVASGKYIQRMSNYCRGCHFDPAESVGSGACPFTTLYWDFLLRHEQRLAGNPRMGMQLRNLGRLSADRRALIQAQAERLRQSNPGA
jgi:deoxyribodipyrimidine photolyase-related protein